MRKPGAHRTEGLELTGVAGRGRRRGASSRLPFWLRQEATFGTDQVFILVSIGLMTGALLVSVSHGASGLNCGGHMGQINLTKNNPKHSISGKCREDRFQCKQRSKVGRKACWKK